MDICDVGGESRGKLGGPGLNILGIPGGGPKKSNKFTIYTKQPTKKSFESNRDSDLT